MNRFKNFLITLLLIIIIAAGAAGSMYLLDRQHKIDDLSGQVSTLKSQLEKLQTKTPAAGTTTTNTTTYTSGKGVKVSVYTPPTNATVKSPLAVLGEVPGNWSFEASFPVRLEDSSGKVVASGTAQVLGDWMTDKLVPFSAKLTYAFTPNGSGKLILQKDNPSGEAKNDDIVTIPVHF